MSKGAKDQTSLAAPAARPGVEAIRAALAECFAARATYRYEFVRNAGDEYEPFLHPLRAEGEGTPLAVAECHLLLPFGGGWSRYREMGRMGIHSLFAIPFLAGKRVWIGVGVEFIVPHATRVAYPISEAYLFECERTGDSTKIVLDRVADGMRRLAAWLRNEVGVAPDAPPVVVDAEGETAVDPAAPLYIPSEAALLERAAARYGGGQLFFLRTLLLSPDMRPAALRRAMGERLPLEIHALLARRDRYLVGVPPWFEIRDPRRPAAICRKLREMYRQMRNGRPNA
jgi:hypothetical protein